MRKTRTYLAVVVTAATALAVAVSGTAIGAAGDPVQRMDAVVSPKKLPAQDLKPAKIKVKTQTYWDDGSGADDQSRVPPHATRAVISLPDNLEFDPSAAKQCRTDISTKSRSAAIAACKSAQVSTNNMRNNTAQAALLLGAPPQRVNVTAQVTAFNGPKQGGKPTLLLHSYIPSLNVTTLLVGVLKNATGKFGTKLDVTIPPLAGGSGAIASFTVEIQRGDYVQGTCPRKDKTLHYAGAFTTTDAGVLKATDQTKCTPVG